MPILIVLEEENNQYRKASLEALCYGVELAKQTNTDPVGLLLSNSDTPPASDLGVYGLKKLYQQKIEKPVLYDAALLTHIVSQAVEKTASTVIIFSNNALGKLVAPRLSVKLKAAVASGVISLPNLENGFVVKKTVFSGKAFAYVQLKSPTKIVCISPNAFKIVQNPVACSVEDLSMTPLPSSTTQFISENKTVGTLSLTEAPLVVSGGRGLKGPQNWKIIEDLAHTLGAATACSRPVSDEGWRPHGEHVGQTGIAIAPNLYIAVGISGAIQHLAGVNQSKTIVVINTDPEAPFFKAADYGIVGDAFEVLPKLTAEIEKMKA